MSDRLPPARNAEHGAQLALRTTILPYFPEQLAERRAVAAEGEAAFARMMALSPTLGVPVPAALALQLLEGDWAAASSGRPIRRRGRRRAGRLRSRSSASHHAGP